MISLYAQDPYLSDIDTAVEAIAAIKGRTALCPRELVFHPAGGGQPSDHGTVTVEGDKYQVERLVKMSGETFLVLSSTIPGHEHLAVGQQPISCRIDWERRYKLMRYHTGAHTLMAAAKRILDGFEPRGMNDRRRCVWLRDSVYAPR